jgi:VWFA-related protein
MRVAAALTRFVLCAFALSSLAIAEEPQQQFNESIEVRLHNLDATVTDRDGKPVAGLTREDFILLENGVLQEITNFSAYDERATTATSVTTTTTLPLATLVAEPETKTSAPPRRFVFFIDDMAIQAAARNKLKKHAAELVRTMRPGDVATIVRPTGTTKIMQEYTSDAALVERNLVKTIDSCRIRMTTPAFRELEILRRALQNATTPNEIAIAKREYVERAVDRVEQRLGQLRALVASMSGAPGKKVLVIITSGLSARPGQDAYSLDEQLGLFERDHKKEVAEQEEAQRFAEENPDLPPGQQGIPGRMSALRADVKNFRPQATWDGMDRARGGDFKSMIDNLARTAAAEGVTIYALEPEVPLMLGVTRSAESKTMGSILVEGEVRGQYTIPGEMLDQLLHHEGETLTSMAEKTGGRWFRGIGSIDETFQQMNADLQVYYSLAYRARGNDAKPRALKLAVRNRPDLKVHTRSETIDHSKARGMADRVVAELVFPGDVNDLQMTVTTEKPQRDGRAFIVPVEVVIPGERMTFVRSNDGTYMAKVSLHYATALDQKEFVSYGRQEQIIELSARQYAELKRIRYRYSSNITVPKGNVRIALGVTDTTSSVSSLRTVAVKAQ